MAKHLFKFNATVERREEKLVELPASSRTSDVKRAFDEWLAQLQAECPGWDIVPGLVVME